MSAVVRLVYEFCEIFTLLLSYVVPVKSKVKLLQNFVAFSEYMNFTNKKCGYANLQNLETDVAGDQTKELKFKTRRRRNLKEKRFPNPHDLRRKEKF